MNQELLTLMENSFKELREHSIVKGIILDIKPQVVLVDIGYKSEGAIPVSEFEDEDIQVGDEIDVLLSRREVIEAERAEQRQRFLETVKIGDKVEGAVKNITDFGVFVDLNGM